tara:strand:- start:603 stop:920 length:318 start_codon:yes stop_codon:yes gene_type:complete
MTKPHWLTGEVIDESTTPWVLGMNKSYFLLGIKSVGIFLLIFIILTLDFLALSVSLQCNRGKPNLPSAIYAFFFGPIYLLVNYYFVRVLSKGESCEFSSENPFSI